MAQKNLNTLIADFSRDLSGLVRESALQAARIALGSSSPNGTPPARAATSPRAVPSGLESRLLNELRAHPNLRTEQLGTALGVPTQRIKPVLAQLVTSGALKKSGQRRGTRYAVAK